MIEFIQFQPECWQEQGLTVPIPQQRGARPRAGKSLQRFGTALIATALAATVVLSSATVELAQPWASALASGTQGTRNGDSEAQVPIGYWDRMALARTKARVLVDDFEDTIAPLV